jgi:hypothetical protein
MRIYPYNVSRSFHYEGIETIASFDNADEAILFARNFVAKLVEKKESFTHDTFCVWQHLPGGDEERPRQVTYLILDKEVVGNDYSLLSYRDNTHRKAATAP